MSLGETPTRLCWLLPSRGASDTGNWGLPINYAPKSPGKVTWGWKSNLARREPHLARPYLDPVGQQGQRGWGI